MARAESLKVGDPVDYCGEACEVVAVSKRSEVIAIHRGGEKGYTAYVYAWTCKKL